MDGIFREMCSTQIFENCRKGQREMLVLIVGKKGENFRTSSEKWAKLERKM